MFIYCLAKHGTSPQRFVIVVDDAYPSGAGQYEPFESAWMVPNTVDPNV